LQKATKLGIILGIIAGAVLVTLGYGLAQRAARDADLRNDAHDIVAFFDSDDDRSSSELTIEVSVPEYHAPSPAGTLLTLGTASYTVMEGDFLSLNGRLTDDSGSGLANKAIIVNEKLLIPDDILGRVFTDSEGYFSFDWQASSDMSGTSEIFASFSGDSAYASSESSESVHVTLLEIPLPMILSSNLSCDA
jgi:hypothetical protein